MTDEVKPDLKVTMDRRGLVLGTAFVLCGGLTAFRQPSTLVEPIPTKTFGAMIPAKVGGWTSQKSAELVLPPADETSDKLYQNLETRVYEGDGLPAVMFLCAYSNVQKNDVQVHRPEVCYPASGYPIIKNIVYPITIGTQKINARFLIADRGGPKEMILYWTRVGDSFPVDWQSQRIDMAMANLAGAIPDGALFRVSMIWDEQSSAINWLRKFSIDMKARSSPKLQQLIFGS